MFWRLIKKLPLPNGEAIPSELITEVNSSAAWNATSDSSFTTTVQAVKGLVHQTIPPAAHTWQADVETVHSTIENEFYMVESFTSRGDFLAKASAYPEGICQRLQRSPFGTWLCHLWAILWYNVSRKNISKNNKTPWQIISESNKNIFPTIAALPPLFLNQLWKLKWESPKGVEIHIPSGLDSHEKRGYDLMQYPPPQFKSYTVSANNERFLNG